MYVIMSYTYILYICIYIYVYIYIIWGFLKMGTPQVTIGFITKSWWNDLDDWMMQGGTHDKTEPPRYLKELVLANIRGDHALDLPGLLGFDLEYLELALSFFVKELSKWMFLNTTNQSDLFKHHEVNNLDEHYFQQRGSLMSRFSMLNLGF